MNHFKLLFFISFLFFGSFGQQRFQRHFINEKNTQIGFIEKLNDYYDDRRDELAADGSPNGIQDKDDVRLVGYAGEVPIELNKNGELEFEFCSDGCIGKKVVVCYDAQNPDPSLKGSCKSNQCEFQAGVSTVLGSSFLWFFDTVISIGVAENEKKCETAVLKSPKASVSYSPSTFKSCKPSINDGNVVNIFVKEVSPGCILKIRNAKIWYPPTPSPTTQPSGIAKTEDSSKAETTIWIILGVLLFFILVGIFGLGFYCCCFKKDKKAVGIFDEKPKEIVLEENKKILETQKINVASDFVKTEEAKKERNETVKEKLSKQKKEEIVKPKATKDAPLPEKKKTAASVEPKTDASTVQPPKEKEEEHFPSVKVLKELVHPTPKTYAKRIKPKPGQHHSNKTDSLSGRHEVSMIGLVESPSESLKHHCIVTGSSDFVDDKLENFYQPGIVRVLLRIEIAIFCCTISAMFIQIERMIDMAEEALAERDVTFDEDGNIIQMTAKAEEYLAKKSTPEYIRSYAFGQIYSALIDTHVGILDTLSIPLLFVIVLQRRYTVLNRRKACAWMRRQMPIVQKEFSTKERAKLPYPINAIEEANKMDSEGFKNISAMDTYSGLEDDETQASTHASEKKNDGKKKKSKKPRAKK